MKLVFTKGTGKYDRLEIIRVEQPIEIIDCPKQRIIPHDMVHYAVESTLRARGFLGRLGQGEAANFRMRQDAESDSIERLVEVFQGDAWSGARSTAPDMIEMYRVTCIARKCPALPVSAMEIESVRARITELSLAWDAVPVGGSLELGFEITHVAGRGSDA